MKAYISKEGLEELKQKLESFKKDARQDIAERLRRAKEFGDLSENSEYIDAKDAQAKLEMEIAELEEKIRNAIVIKKDKSGVVGIGSTVEVLKNGKRMRYTIVGGEEADPARFLISNESPLGQAFLGKKSGDTAEITVPSGKAAYKILKIE
ncbi:transcription elongation factor GreA [Candidatus Wolfebacteria bacterium]|nr:transcription elongation factor GreA [Candidatus Wolfebacteria bacterium]